MNLDRVRVHLARAGRTIASNRSLVRMRVPRILTAATVTMSSLRGFEPGRLAVDRHRLVGRRRLEQEAIGGIACSRAQIERAA